MSAARLALTIFVLVIGGFGLLVSHDIRSWRSTLTHDGLQYTARPKETLPLTAPTVLPSGVSAELLSVDDDRRWLRGLQLFDAAFELTNGLDALGLGDFTILDESASALDPLTQSRNSALASQAYDLLAVLLFREAYPGSGVNTSIVSEAVIDLQNAVELDPANELAKENLELALRVAFATHAAVQFPSGDGNHIAPRREGGAGEPPGEGY